MVDFTVKVEVTKDVKFLQANCGVRYWEDAEVNGVEDEDGTLIPFRSGDAWKPLIDLEAGAIIDWPEGTTASIHYKVCDAGIYTLLDAEKNEVAKIDGYVPSIMSPGGSGYGDYVIMEIDGEGKIANFEVDLDDFEASHD